MRLSKLKLAIGGLLGAGAMVAGTAQALPPADYDGTVLNVYFGGATATDGILENTFLATTGGVCAPGTIDIYRVSVANRNNRVIFCRVTSAEVPGFPAAPGTKVAFHKESIGGSSNGVVPLFSQSNLQFFNMAVANTCTDSGLVGPTADLRQYRNWTACPDNTVNRIPNGGISDTEPNLSFPTPTPAQINTLTSTPGLGIVFGVPVTLKLYRALQVAQGLGQTDNLADVPTLTSAQIRGLYTQRISSWSQIRNNANVSITVGAPNPPANAGGTLADDAVFICRRVNSSGTQASAESYWLQGRCDAKFGSTGSPVFAGGQGATMDTGTTPTAQAFASRVTPNEGSGDVRTCLNQHDANGTWAIGVLSTEVSATQLGSFRMVKVDGAAPNLASVANGDYDFFSENTLNRRATGQSGAPTGLTLTLLQYLEGNIGRPNVLRLTNSTFEGRPWGDGGVLTLASAAAFAPNAPPQVNGAVGVGTMRDNPVNTQSRSLISNRVNNCSPAVMTDPSPTP